MKNLLSTLLLISLLTACNPKTDGVTSDCAELNQETGTCTVTTDDPVVVDDPSVEPTPTPVPDDGTGLPNEAYTFETNITFINMTAEQEAKFEKALEVIKKVVATEEFRTKILNHTYGGSKTFVDNNGHSNQKIYDTILAAAETLQPVKNNTMDMEVELYYENNNVVGYTNGSTKRIWVNTKYFNTNPIGAVANNLFHEWLHKLGYGHSYYYSTSRDYSVPYAVGDIVESIGKQFL